MSITATPPSASADQYMRLLKLITSELQERSNVLFTAAAAAVLFQRAFDQLSDSDDPDKLLTNWENRKKFYVKSIENRALVGPAMIENLQRGRLIDTEVIFGAFDCMPDGPA